MGAEPTHRRLSEMLQAKCDADGITLQRASEIMGQSPNAVSRWISLAIFPGPRQYEAIADWLGITTYEVGGALALDQIEKARSTELLRDRIARTR